MAHTQYLQQRGQGWYVRVRVPPSLVASLGKAHVVRSLQTRDVAEARRRRWVAVAGELWSAGREVIATLASR